MKSFRIISLEKLIANWSKVDCSITLHYTNEKLYLNALTKNRHQIVIAGHHSLFNIFKEYPILMKLITKYTIEFSYNKGIYCGEIYYYELAKTYEKKLLKAKASRDFSILMNSLEASLEGEFKYIERELIERKNAYLEVYGGKETLEACFIDKKTNYWLGACPFIKNTPQLFPNLTNVIKKENNLYLNYVSQTRVYEATLKEKRIVSTSLLEILESLENSLKQEKEYHLNLVKK